jgi:hypothetical protein
MNSKSETGHGTNIGNFQKLLLGCDKMGIRFNPSNPLVTLVALHAVYENVVNIMSLLGNRQNELLLAIDSRQALFEGLSKHVTRMYNAAVACGVDKKQLEDLKTLKRKLQGKRAKPKKVQDLNAEQVQKYISVSQLSIDNLIQNFEKMMQFLISLPEYAPNEEDLSPAGLDAHFHQMKDTNKAVIIKNSEVNAARAERNAALYEEKTGILSLAVMVKSYVLATFGSASPEYKEIKGLRFKNIV